MTPDEAGEVVFTPDEVMGQTPEEVPPSPSEVPVNIVNRWIWEVPRGADGWDPLTVPVANSTLNAVTQILGAHPLRRTVTLYNSGTQVVFVGKGSDVSAGGTNSYAIPVNGTLTIPYRGPIYATQATPGTAGAQLSVSPIYEVI